MRSGGLNGARCTAPYDCVPANRPPRGVAPPYRRAWYLDAIESSIESSMVSTVIVKIIIRTCAHPLALESQARQKPEDNATWDDEEDEVQHMERKLGVECPEQEHARGYVRVLHDCPFARSPSASSPCPAHGKPKARTDVVVEAGESGLDALQCWDGEAYVLGRF